MINTLLNFVAPHYCYGCQKIGTTLCQNCEFYIRYEPFSQCLICLVPVPKNGICKKHKRQYFKTWCLGERHDALERLIDAYKFENNKDAARALGRTLARSMPTLPTNTILVPVPTIATHIRQRGYDHIELIAKQIAKKCGGTITPLIARRGKFVQRGASKAARLEQSERSFYLKSPTPLSPKPLYIIIDDVYTTGATTAAIAKILHQSGAQMIALAVATRQTLDD